MNLKNIRLSISKKLILIYSSILLSILIFFTLLTFFMIRNLIINDTKSQISSSADIIGNYISTIDIGNINEASFGNMNLSQGVFFSVFDKDKKLLYSNRPKRNFAERDEKHEKYDGYEKDKKHESDDKNSAFKHQDGNIYITKIIRNRGSVYYLEVEKDYEDIGNKAGTLETILIITTILGTIVCFISGSFLTKKLLMPLKEITNTAKEITSSSLNKRIVTNGADDELKDLADTFNSMIERLEVDFEKQKRFVSDASHELRTPLAVIHGHVNMLNRWGKDDKEVLERSLKTLTLEIDNVNKLIKNLLYLARGDNDVITVKKEEFSLNMLLKEVVDETLLTNSNNTISYICENGLTINADYDLIKQVLRIIIDNSIKYSNPSDEITIQAKEEIAGTIVIVKDKGIGISKESLPHIFERFYRADESRTKSTGGTGLGLSIAKQIVSLHGGEIYAESEALKGTSITIFIPKNNI